MDLLRRARAVAAIGWLLLAAGLLARGADAIEPPAARYRPGRVIIKYKPAGLRALAAGETAAPDRISRKFAVRGSRQLFSPGIGAAAAGSAQTLKQRFPRRAARARPGAVAPELGNIYILEVSTGTDIQSLAAELAKDPDVEYATPDMEVQLYSGPDYWSTSGSWSAPTADNPEGDPADTYPDMWAPKIIQADLAWTRTQGEGAIVAVVDTGVDYMHPGIQANLWRTPGGAFGFNTVNKTDHPNDPYGPNDPMDNYGHGTHASGIVAAIGLNGVKGVAPKAKLMAVRVFALPAFVISDAVAGMRLAVDNGADVISCSWGGVSFTSAENNALADVLNYANANGVVVVAAAGNFGQQLTTSYFPAGYPTVIGVAATSSNDTRPVWSNFGGPTAIGAPGGNACTTACAAPGNEFTVPGSIDRHSILGLKASLTAYPARFKVGTDNLYYRMGGTSMSSPMTAGVAALVLSAKPTATVAEVRSILMTTADDIGDPQVGAGRINANKAVLKALGLLVTTPAPVISNVVVSAIGPNQATVSWTTDILADGSVDSGLSAGTYPTRTLDSNNSTRAHSVTITGLSPSTVYHYVARSKGTGPLATTSDAVFTTNSPATNVTITRPANGATIPQGFLYVEATVSNPSTIGFVEFFDNGVNLGARSVDPATGKTSFSWDTFDAPLGSVHTMTAIAYKPNGTDGQGYPQTILPTFTSTARYTVASQVATYPVTFNGAAGMDVYIKTSPVWGYQHDVRSWAYAGTTPVTLNVRPEMYELMLLQSRKQGSGIQGGWQTVAPGPQDWSWVTLGAAQTTASPEMWLTLPSTSNITGTTVIEGRAYDMSGTGIKNADALIINPNTGVTVATVPMTSVPPVYRVSWNSATVPDGVYHIKLRATDNANQQTPWPQVMGVRVSNATDPTLPIIAQFSASPLTIRQGQSTSLSWTTYNTNSCSASSTSGGGVAGGGTVFVTMSPVVTTTYSLTCTNAQGTAQAASVTVTVDPSANPPTINTFTAASPVISAGQSTTLSWAATGATGCGVNNGGPSGGASGSGTVSPARTTTYVLTCTGAGGGSTRFVRVIVLGTTPRPIIAQFSANPPAIASGETSWLSWGGTMNVEQCTMDNGGGLVGPSNSRAVSPTVTTTYTLSCTNADTGAGTATASLTLPVNGVVSPPSIQSFTATPAAIAAGGSSMLSWSATNAAGCTINNNGPLGGIAGSGSVSPLVTTTYTLTCSGSGAAATANVTVTVGAPAAPTITSFTASPAAIASGGSATLSWAAANATACSVAGGPSGGAAGSGTVSPTATTTYTLTCTGAGGSVTATASVAVNPPPVVASFTATPAAIISGGSATLAWSASNATACSVAGGPSGGASGSGAVSPTVTTTYTLTCSGAGGSVTAAAVVAVIPPPVIASFTATPATIARGGSSTLTWSASNATACNVGGGPSGGASGSGTVTPTTTTTYTLTCTGAGGSVTASAAVTVNQPPVIASFTATPATIINGASSTLAWSASNATACGVSGGPSGGAIGSGAVSPTATTSFTLTCTGPGGSASGSATVTVIQPPVIASFTATPATIARGTSSTLAWSASNAAACSVAGGPSGGASGSGTVSPATTTTYTLTCTGAGGSVSGSLTVTVNQPPVIASFTATPATIARGASATLAWSASNATACAVAGGPSGVASGSGTVAPTTTTTYTLTCTGAGGSAAATAAVTVNQPPVIASFTAAPATIIVGASSTLAWSASNATTCAVAGGPSGGASGNGTIAPTATTTYTLTCTGPGGSAAATASLTVNHPAPVVASFTASPATINRGAAATLSWSASNATGCSVNNGGPTGAGSGSGTVSPAATTAYTLTCTGPGGSVTGGVTVTVIQPAPVIASFTANPMTIIAGGAATLSWSASNATACAVAGGPSGGSSGSGTVSPTATTTYTLTCSGPGGTAAATATVTVNQPAPVVVSFTASPATLINGGSATLSWVVSNATGCAVAGGPSGGASGSGTVTPAATTTYTLACSGPGGGVTATAAVIVNPRPPLIASFTASPATIITGGSTTLAWSASNATACSVNNGGPSGGASGSGTVAPTATTAYTLTCSGPGGIVTGGATVTVNQPPPVIASFTASPATITSGGSATLAWSASNAAACSVNGVPSGGAAGAGLVSPSATTAYTLTCSGPGGTATATASVTVTPRAPVITSFVASPMTIISGETATLTWSASDATACGVAGGPSGGGSGSGTVAPTATTVYTLTCTGPGGSAAAAATVTFNADPQAPRIASFTASPTTIIAGGATMLSWVASQATVCGVDHDGPSGGASGAGLAFPEATSVYTLTCSGPGGSTTATAAVTVRQTAPLIASFSATPATIFLGGAATLSWSASNATTCGVAGGPSGGASGGGTVAPTANTVYTLTCTGPGGSVSALASVTVNPRRPAIASFTASPPMILTGGSATLSWSASDSTACVVNNGGPSGGAAGAGPVSPTATKIYTLTCSGPGGTASAAATVTVNQPSPVVASFTASPMTITAGGASALSWSASNASACGVNNAGPSGGASGAGTVTPAATTVYTLTCTGPGGSATATSTVTVNHAPPVISSFTATPMTIVVGGSATLLWSASNATACAVAGGPSGWATGYGTVAPTATTAYTLTCSGPGGSVSATATVTVNPRAPVIAFFTANSAAINAGQSSVLSWSAANATACAVAGGPSGGPLGSGAVAPTATKAYTLTCSGPGGSAAAVATVTVNQLFDARHTMSFVQGSMTRGQRSIVFLEFKNTGDTTWDADFSLAPQDASWGLSRIPLGSREAVRPGGARSFAFFVQAPAAPGLYPFRWRLQRSGQSFGASSPDLSVAVNDLAGVGPSLDKAATALGSGSRITLRGSRFEPGAVVLFVGPVSGMAPAEFVDSHTLRFQLPTASKQALSASALESGDYQVAVQNPGSAGGQSSPITMSIGTAGAGAGSFTNSFAYPNPAVGSKRPTLHFELDGAVDEVKIKIFDVAGKLADQKVLDGSVAIISGAGTAVYEYTWDNSSAASGVYLYVIEARKAGARVTRTGKLAIVR